MSPFELNLVFYALTLYFQGFMSETFDFEKSEQKYFTRNLCRPRLPGICSTLKNQQGPNSRTSLRLKLEMQMPDLAPQEVNSNLLFSLSLELLSFFQLALSPRAICPPIYTVSFALPPRMRKRT